VKAKQQFFGEAHLETSCVVVAAEKDDMLLFY
jgi:hypothetical protein